MSYESYPPNKNSRVTQALHIDHLRRHWELLIWVQARHVKWMNEAEDPKVREMYAALAKSVEQVVLQYEELIETLQLLKDKD